MDVNRNEDQKDIDNQEQTRRKCRGENDRRSRKAKKGMRKRKCNAVGKGHGRLKLSKFKTEGKEGKRDVEVNSVKIFVVRKRTKNNVR